jgi:hypothetical protein
MTEINDPNILRCAVKKTLSLWGKHILYASYLIDGIAAAILAYFGIVGVWQALSPIAERLWEALTKALFAVPWYVYGIVVILGAYFGYSLLWCMARNLADEDWQSEKAKKISENIALALALAFALALALAFALAAFAALAALALALAFAAFAALAFADSGNCKAFLFIGAYLYYRERMSAPEPPAASGKED